MDPLQPSPAMPRIVQVYSSVADNKMQSPQIIQLSTHPSLTTGHVSKVYQQAITSESLSIPVSEVERMQSQIVMPCPQTQLQSLQPVTMQSQVLQTDVPPPPLQFNPLLVGTSLPPAPPAPPAMLDGHAHAHSAHAYYTHYSYVKESSLDANTDSANSERTNDPKPEPPVRIILEVEPKLARQKKRAGADQSRWACNVRKMKHQSGEAYVSRRGKYVPERQIKNHKNCLTSCKMKCNGKICDTDRELIFKAFYSLKGNEKRHFLLNTTERHEVKRKRPDDQTRRQHTFKYFFLVRGVKHAVCKDFYLGTLAISQKPVYNVHASKSELNIPKPDGRGLSASSIHSLPASLKDSVRSHIASFKTRDGSLVKQFSRKKQHLEQNCNIKQMYMMYVSDCQSKDVSYVKQSMYRKILKEEFNIHFAQERGDKLCVRCREPIKKIGK